MLQADDGSLIYPVVVQADKKYTANIKKGWAIIPTEGRFKALVTMEKTHRKVYDDMVKDDDDESDDVVKRIDMFDYGLGSTS